MLNFLKSMHNETLKGITGQKKVFWLNLFQKVNLLHDK
jgi:hypothetical protein